MYTPNGEHANGKITDSTLPMRCSESNLRKMARTGAVAARDDHDQRQRDSHAEDFAGGLVGLLGSPPAIGQTFDITGSDAYTCDEIYMIVGDALGV